MGATTGDPTSDQTGVVICIAALPDGTYQIYQQGDQDQSGGAPASAQGGMPSPSGAPSPDDDSGNSQTADNIQDALQIAGQMLQGGDQDDDSGQGQDGNAELSPSDAKAAWNQMAAKSDKKRSMGM